MIGSQHFRSAGPVDQASPSGPSDSPQPGFTDP
jgi:hypothetical protein